MTKHKNSAARCVALCLGLLVLLAPATIAASAAESRVKINLNPVWRFYLGDPPGEPFQANYDERAWDVVSLPHTHEIFPADLAGFGEHGRNVGWYRREIQVPAGWLSKKVFLEFQGAMQTTRLWVNGALIGEYAVSGYDSFHFDITPHLKAGKNQLAVRVDNTVNPDIPPDGRWIDFIPFGGLYRDVSLVVIDTMHLTFPWEAPQAGVRLTLPEVSAEQAVVKTEATVRNESSQPRTCTLVTEIRDRDGKVVAQTNSQQQISAGGEFTFVQTLAPLTHPRLWSPDDPYLYRVRTLVREGDRELDRLETALGIRWFKFDKQQGFFLNGKHLKLVGANRHQTWPFIGNAVPNGLHRRDAEQLKAMGCNWVRLSHYPHDPDFLDALDELGMMALEEGPTWMGSGNAKWMAHLEKSFRSMIRRDRNHPCIIIWNACINHSDGEPSLVQAAKEEDPTRPRGQSDIPCPMNFSHQEISGNGALTIEHTGHTYPTSRGDRLEYGRRRASWEGQNTTANREYDLAKRHWENTDAAYRRTDNSGLAVWCMYDYNTFHNALEGIARHGVFDLFRIPKYSYWWHVSELTRAPMAYVVRVDETNACVFSNCDQVRLSQDTGGGYQAVATQKPVEGYVLQHPPFLFTVDAQAVALKAEGLSGGTVQASNEWKRAGQPVALTLDVDRPTLTADGSDLSRITATAVDANGIAVDTCAVPVTFTVDGLGQLVGENPISLRAGKIIILAQSAFVPGELTIRATAAGLRPGQATVKTLPVASGVDLPSNLPAKQPTRSNRVVIPKASDAKELPWLAFESKTNVPPSTWVESNPIMIPGSLKEAPIEIRGGEYRIYTSPWTDQPGKVVAGDAVYVRLRTTGERGASAWAELTIGNLKTRFEVRTVENPNKRN
jgi:beta-galactosidase